MEQSMAGRVVRSVRTLVVAAGMLAAERSSTTGAEATHAGVPELDCRGRVSSAPAPFLIDRSRAQGTFQPEFRDAALELALWAVRRPEVGSTP